MRVYKKIAKLAAHWQSAWIIGDKKSMSAYAEALEDAVTEYFFIQDYHVECDWESSDDGMLYFNIQNLDGRFLYDVEIMPSFVYKFKIQINGCIDKKLTQFFEESFNEILNKKI